MNPAESLDSPAARELWTELLQTIPLGLFLVDLETARALTNPSFASLLGFDLADCTPSLMEFFRSRLLEGEAAKLQRRLTELRKMGPREVAEVDAWFTHRDGTQRCLRAAVSALRESPDGPVVRLVGGCRDLTNRVDDEAALRASEALNRGILDSSGDCIKVLSATGALLSMNGPGTRLMEIDNLADHLGCPWPDLWGPSSDAARAAVTAAAAGLETRFQAACPTAKGTMKHWDVIVSPISQGDGVPVTRLVSISRDVTAQREYEETLRQAFAHTSNVLASLSTFVGLLELDGTLRDANRAALQAGGLELEEVLGLKFWETPWLVWDPGVVEQTRQAVLAAAGGEVVRFGAWVRMAGGEKHFVDMCISPLRDEMGRITHLVPSGTDITDRYRAEKALREADQRKDDFLAMLAHELRNPLAAIQNALSVSDESPHYTQDAHWARGVISRQAEMLHRMVDDLLDVSRISKGKINLQTEPIDLSAPLRRAAETVISTLGAKGQRLACRFAAGPIPVNGDAARLEQAMVNLLTNASRYSPRGKRVDFHAGMEEGSAVITVRDYGIGIAPEMIPRIFELFGQLDSGLDRTQGGLGIGLTLARDLVALHGGTLEVHSEGPERGSSFVIRLPLLKDPLPAARPPEPAASAVAGGLRVLIVDDNEDAARGLARLLTRRGHTVQEAADGTAAIAVAAAFQPHVVLLDIGLPGIDGYGVARHLRGPDGVPGVCIIGISGYARQHDRTLAKEAGFDHHLLKPVVLAEILQLLPTPPATDSDV